MSLLNRNLFLTILALVGMALTGQFANAQNEPGTPVDTTGDQTYAKDTDRAARALHSEGFAGSDAAIIAPAIDCYACKQQADPSKTAIQEKEMVPTGDPVVPVVAPSNSAKPTKK